MLQEKEGEKSREKTAAGHSLYKKTRKTKNERKDERQKETTAGNHRTAKERTGEMMSYSEVRFSSQRLAEEAMRTNLTELPHLPTVADGWRSVSIRRGQLSLLSS